MVTRCHSENTLDSIRASFRMNHLLLSLWCKRFVGRFELPKSALHVECEVLGTPVPENVFIEPHSASPEGTFWFWMKRVSQSGESNARFLFSPEESPLCKTVYVIQFENMRSEVSVFDHHCCQKRRSVELTLSHRFQGLLMSYLEVDCF